MEVLEEGLRVLNGDRNPTGRRTMSTNLDPWGLLETELSIEEHTQVGPSTDSTTTEADVHLSLLVCHPATGEGLSLKLLAICGIHSPTGLPCVYSVGQKGRGLQKGFWEGETWRGQQSEAK